MPQLPSLIPNLGYIVEHLAEWSLIFVGLFLVLSFLLVREKLGAMLLGFSRTIGSVFTSPFIYLRKISLQLAAFGKSGDQSFRSSRLYLVNKLLVAIQAVLIVAALGGLAVTIIAAWDAFMPPQWLRTAISRLDSQLSEERRQQEPASNQVRQLEADWQAQGKAIVDKRQLEEKQKVAKSLEDNSFLSSSLDTDQEMRQPLQSLKNYLSQNDAGGTEAAFDTTRKNASAFIDRIDLPEAKQAKLVEYVKNWHTAKLAQLRLKAMSEESIRSEVQPGYREQKMRAAALEERVRLDSDQLSTLRAQAAYSPTGLVTRLAEGLVAFLATVWVFGLLIELLSLAVHVADDIRALRESDAGRPSVGDAREAVIASAAVPS